MTLHCYFLFQANCLVVGNWTLLSYLRFPSAHENVQWFMLLLFQSWLQNEIPPSSGGSRNFQRGFQEERHNCDFKG